MKWLPVIFNAGLFVSFLVYAWADSPQTLTAEMYPVKWASAVSLKAQTQIDNALQKPLDMSGSGGTLECFHNEDTDVTTDCKTCEDYFKWLSDGNTPENTYQITMESWFKFACLPLKFLKQSIPSKYNFVESVDLTTSDQSVLDPVITIVADPSRREIGARNKNSITLNSEDDVISIEQIAWGDYNHDGNEDSLWYVSYTVKEGTLRYYTCVIVTKLSRNGALSVISELK